MPTYEYLCGACENNFEQVQKITEDSLKTCPKCGKDELRRLVNAAAFHLKGSGWYKTDYASSSSSSQSSAPTSSATASNDSKTDSSSTSSEKVATPAATLTPSSTDSSPK